MIWNIVSDSSCDLLRNGFDSRRVRFESVPLRIRVGEREFADTDELDVSELLRAMREEKSASSSSCPSPGDYANAFEKGEKTVCFTISGSLSGSFNAAMQGRSLTLEKHPEKEICVIDSRGTAGVLHLLIEKARELMENAAEDQFAAICAELERYRNSLRTCFTLENFDNLVKNGRMRPLVGVLLQKLGIHVVAEGDEAGAIRVVGKARGEKRTFRAMTALMERTKNCSGASVVIAHCNNPGGAARLKEEILKSLPVKSVRLQVCRGLNTFYAMDQGLIVGY